MFARGRYKIWRAWIWLTAPSWARAEFRGTPIRSWDDGDLINLLHRSAGDWRCTAEVDRRRLQYTRGKLPQWLQMRNLAAPDADRMRLVERVLKPTKIF